MDERNFLNASNSMAKYLLNDIVFNNIIFDLEKTLKENEAIIKDALKVDNAHTKKQIKLDNIIKIIEMYKNFSSISFKDDQRKIVEYYGDPYLTVHLCMQALAKKTRILLITRDYMMTINEVLIKIFNDVFAKHQIFNLISIDSNILVKQLEDVAKIFDELIIMGDSTTYEMVKQNNNVRYIPYNNIGIYCDSEKLEDLAETIRAYSVENNYETEMFYDDSKEDVVGELNIDYTKVMVVLLTENEDTIDYFKNNLKNKIIYVNNNPFTNEIGDIKDYLK